MFLKAKQQIAMLKIKAVECIVCLKSPSSLRLIFGGTAVGLKKLMIESFVKSCNL